MKQLSDLVINQNGFVFDPSLGEGYLLNESGLMVLKHLREGSSIEDVGSVLATTYHISLGQAFSDILDFIGKLRIFGFEVKR